VYAERCLSAGKCETATSARIWLDKYEPSDKRTSGKYDMNFGGEHLEGTFLAGVFSSFPDMHVAQRAGRQ